MEIPLKAGALSGYLRKERRTALVADAVTSASKGEGAPWPGGWCCRAAGECGAARRCICRGSRLN